MSLSRDEHDNALREAVIELARIAGADTSRTPFAELIQLSEDRRTFAEREAQRIEDQKRYEEDLRRKTVEYRQAEIDEAERRRKKLFGARR